MRATSVTAAMSVVAGIAMMVWGQIPFWWIGAGLIVAGLGTALLSGADRVGALVDWLQKPRQVAGVEFVPQTLLAELGCLAVLATVTTVMLPEAAVGDRPVTHDHTVHFFKAWQLEQHFLAEGHLYGWSHKWFAGYPAQYLYPIGADLLVVAIHGLTFGLIDFGHAYAWAIWLFWFLGGYAVYRFATPLIGRAGGLVAAFLFMTDTAAYRIGGWYFAVEWGVWPMSLSIVLAVWAMARVPRLMEGDRWRDVAIFGLLMGASLVTHPFMLIHFALVLTATVLAFWLADTETAWLVGTGRLVVGSAIGGLVGSIWVLPFMSSSDAMDPNFGGVWTSYYEMGEGIYQLDLLPETWAVVIALGVIGMVAMLFSRRFDHLLCGIICATFVVVGSTDFLAGFNFLDVFTRFQRVHFMRFITLLKPYWMVAAAYGLMAVVRYGATHAIDLWGRDGGGAAEAGAFRRWVRLFLLGFCLVPLAVPFAHHYGSEQVDRQLINHSDRPEQGAQDRIVEWFAEKFPDGEPFFRVGLHYGRHDHHLVDLGTRLPFPVYKMGYTPATSYAYRMESRWPATVESLNVRYVISYGDPRGPYTKVADFGPLKLYEFDRWNPEPFEVIEGEGPVELKHFGDEEIVLEAGEGATGRLRLNVSHFSRWHAYRDGRELTIEPTRVANDKATGFMTVDLEPGTYRFVFERGWPETIGWMLFLLGMLAALALLLADTSTRVGQPVGQRLDGLRDRLEELLERYDPWVGRLGRAMVVGGMLFVFWMAWHWPTINYRGSDLPSRVADVHYDFGDQMRDGRAEMVGSNNWRKPCRRLLGYFVCGNDPKSAVYQRVADFGPSRSMARCIWAPPQSEGALQLQFDEVPAGEAIVGFYGIVESGKSSAAKPTNFKVGVDGVFRYTGEVERTQKISEFQIPLEEAADGEAIDVVFDVRAPDIEKRHFCFNAQVVDLVSSAEPPPAADEGDASP